MTPFMDSLRIIRDGEFLEEIEEEFTELMRQIKRTRKGGTLVLKVKIAPTSERQCQIDGNVEAKSPQLPKGATIAFYDDDDDTKLHRNDPRQKKFDFKEVPKQTAELKEIGNAK